MYHNADLFTFKWIRWSVQPQSPLSKITKETLKLSKIREIVAQKSNGRTLIKLSPDCTSFKLIGTFQSYRPRSQTVRSDCRTVVKLTADCLAFQRANLGVVVRQAIWKSEPVGDQFCIRNGLLRRFEQRNGSGVWSFSLLSSARNGISDSIVSAWPFPRCKTVASGANIQVHWKWKATSRPATRPTCNNSNNNGGSLRWLLRENAHVSYLRKRNSIFSRLKVLHFSSCRALWWPRWYPSDEKWKFT